MFNILLLVLMVIQSHCIQQCSRWSEVEPHDDCHEIAFRNDISVKDLKIMNSELNCDHLQTGHQTCTAVSRYSYSKAEYIDCIEKKVVEEEASCLELARQASITIDEFKVLNPDLDCDEQSIMAGVDVCFKGSASINCADVQVNKFENTCEHFMEEYDLTEEELLRLNPLFDCDVLQENKEICVGLGPFKYSECTENIKVIPEIDTCSKLSQTTHISEYHIMSMNPTIDCSSKLTLNSLVCVQSLGMDTLKAGRLLMNSLGSVDDTLFTEFKAILSNPKVSPGTEITELLLKSVGKENVNSHLKDLYLRSVDIRKIIDFRYPLAREEYCQQSKKRDTSENIQNCYCGNSELIIYCRSLEQQQLSHQVMRKMSNRPSNETVKRSKRRTCRMNLFKLFEGCIAGGCVFPIPPIEIKVEAEFCFTDLFTIADSLDTCSDGASGCKEFDKVCGDFFDKASELHVDVKIGVCVVGKALLEMFKLFKLPCIRDTTLKIYPYTGMMHLESEIKREEAKIEVLIDSKLYDVKNYAICKFPAHKNKYYCEWKKYKMVAKGHVEIDASYRGMSLSHKEKIWITK